MPEVTAHGSTATTNGNGHVSFSELVRAHHAWDTSPDESAAEEVKRRFQELLASFEAEVGEIVDAYWCRQQAAGVALTRRQRELRGGVLGTRHKLEYRLHRVSDWVTDDTHEISDLLHDCDILAIKAANSLESVPRAVVMQWLLLVESHLLGFLERSRSATPNPEQTRRFAASERAELRRIEDYYLRAGEKRARMRYAEGMLGLGLVLLFASALISAGVLGVFGALDLESDAVREFYAAAAAGGIGAVISALMRMSGRGDFAIDPELARHLERTGRLVRLGDGWAVSAAVYERARSLVRAECTAAGRIALARFRDLAGCGRRDAQLLLERLDADGVTRRVGDARVLRRRAS